MKIGNNFEVTIPEFDIKEMVDIGGYKIIIKKTGEAVVQGISLFSISDAMIGIIAILPLDTDAQQQIEDFPFDIEEHHLVYQVSFNRMAWYFNKKIEAYELMDTILQIKEIALHNKFINNIVFDSDEKE